MASTRDLTLRFAADTAKLKAATGDLTKTLDKTAGEAGKAGGAAATGYGRGFGTKIKTVAKSIAGPLLALFAADKVIDFGKAVTEEASNLEQSVGGVQAIFKKHAGQMLKISEDAAQRFGLSQNEFNELAAQLGAGLKNKGVKDFAGATEDLIGMGSDLAAQFGGSTKEAVGAIGSALRGETDPIERYGVSMKAANIEAEALALGLAKPVKNMDEIKTAQIRATLAQRKYNDAVKEHGASSEEALTAEARLGSAQGVLEKKLKGSKVQLTESQKAQAALSLLTKQTADATGAFGRESDTLAGQQQRATAQWNNLKATIGNAFLPVLSQAMTFINSTALPAIKSFGGAISAGVAWVKRYRDILLPLGVALGVATAAMAAMALQQKIAAAGGFLSWLKNLQVVTKTATAIQWLYNAALTANPIGLIIAAIAGLVAGLVIFFTKTETGRKVWAKFSGAIVKAGKAIVGWFKNTLLPFFTETLPGGFRKSIEWIKAAWSKVSGLLLAPFRIGRDAIKKAWGKIKDGFSAAKNWVSGTWKKGWSAIKGVIGGAVEKGRDAVGKALGRTGIRERFNGLKTWAGGTWKRSWKAAKGWISDPIGSAKKTIDTHKKNIQGAFNALDGWGKKTFGPKWDKIKDKLKNPIATTVKTYKHLFGEKGPIRRTFNGFITAAGKIFGKLKGAVTAPIKAVINAVNRHLIKGGINWILGKLGVPKDKQVPWIPVPKFASGGRVRPRNAWQAGGTDRILSLLDRDEQVINRRATRDLDRAMPGGLDYLNRTGRWPVGPAAETEGAQQNRRPGPSAPVDLGDLPDNLRKIARSGPRATDRSGWGALNPVGWAEGREGDMGWYNRCLAFVNAAWNYTVSRFRLFSARASMDAGPLSTAGVPPAGAGVYWDTGPYGHIALAAGDGSVYSNDIRAAGRIDQVPQGEIDKWGPYRGWWHPHGAAPGKGGILGAIGGAISGALDFLKGLSPVEWLMKKAGEVGRGTAGGGAFGSGLLGRIPKLIIDKAKDWILEKIGGIAGWAGGDVRGFSQDQLGNAATIMQTAKRLGFGERGALIGLITAMQESTLRNLSYGDRDSVGLFQQRAPWGSFADRTNPAKAAQMFYLGGQGGQPGLTSKAWRSLSPGAAAQAVQVSAYPGLYAPHIPAAQRILAASKLFDTGGILKPGLTLAYNGTGRNETVRTAEQEAALQRPTVINITVQGSLNDDRTIGKLITEIERYQRRRGPVVLARRSA